MKKTYLLKGLDCPNCSAKIEREVGALQPVRSSAVNLMKQTLTVDIDDEAAKDFLGTVQTIVHSHEPDIVVTDPDANPTGESEEPQEEPISRKLLRLSIGAVLFTIGLILNYTTSPASFPLHLPILLIAYLLLGYDVVWNALRNLFQGRLLDENFLMSISSIGAFILGDTPEAVAVMLFYQIGEFFQDLAVERSRKSITDLMEIRPDTAIVDRQGIWQTVSPELVHPGDVILVKPGEKIPLDGVLLEGESMLDTKALTGESTPRTVRPGDEILSGCINGSAALTIRVTKTYGESTVAKIIDLVENASSRKAKTENFITKFARYYTPAVVLAAALLAVLPPLLFDAAWSEWIRRGFVFLVVSCPCALVISIPLTFFGGIGAASRHGILIKGGNYLEALHNVRTVVFDKTGTLTRGTFEVTEILPASTATSAELLRIAAETEQFSTHPIAKSILTAHAAPVDPAAITDYTEIPGHGIRATLHGKTVLAGNARLMERENIPYSPCEKAGTKVYVALDYTYLGCILIADKLKADSKQTIQTLKKRGVTQTVLLTGDDESIAKSVATDLAIDEYHAGLLPVDKVALLEIIDSRKPKNTLLAFVGDGINDAPVLARADVGIAMGGLGSDAAIEAADVVLMTDEPSKLTEAIDIARATRRIVTQNIVFALMVKALFLVLGAFGIAGMWEAVFGDVGVALIAVFNAMRILKK